MYQDNEHSLTEIYLMIYNLAERAHYQLGDNDLELNRIYLRLRYWQKRYEYWRAKQMLRQHVRRPSQALGEKLIADADAVLRARERMEPEWNA